MNGDSMKNVLIALVMVLGFQVVVTPPVQATVAGHTAETVVVVQSLQDIAAKKVGTWDCAAYSWDNDSAFRRCSDTCAYSGVYHIRVKLSQYVGGGQVEYQNKNGFDAMIGSGDNNGSRVMWNGAQWDLVWMRMVGGDGCTSPIKYP